MMIILGVKITANIATMKNPCFGYFCSFLTRALTPRSLNTYIYLFQAFFALSSFYGTFCCFLKARVELFNSTWSFGKKTLNFGASMY